MAVHVACPACQSVLIVPDGCTGRPTRCPCCSADFTIGTDLEAATAGPPACAVAAPVAGQVTQADIDRAKAALERLTIENVAAQVELARLRRRRQGRAARLAWLETTQTARDLLDHSCGRAGGAAITAAVVPALLLVAASVFSPSALANLVVILVGLVMAAVLYFPLAYWPHDSVVASEVPAAAERLRETAEEYERHAGAAAELKARLDAAEAEHRRLMQAADSRLHWLRTCHWQQMAGRNFANFVALALEEHGYTAEATQRADQWRNLLVVQRGARRLAVLARGAPDRPLDIDVVQQARSSVNLHGCSTAVIVTNGRFTAPARELAEATECKLIDGTQIGDLIEGRLPL